MNLEAIVQGVVMASLVGLLLASGLRLTFAEVVLPLRDTQRLLRTLVVNFGAVPLLAVLVVRGLPLAPEATAGILLLAAAPFAPVVPIFTRMSRGDLALAAGLTAVYPFFCAFLTPWVCALALRAVSDAAALPFRVLPILVVLVTTITLPLVAGVALRHAWPWLAARMLRPVEIASEALGAGSLALVTFAQWKTVTSTGWLPLATMGVLGELWLLLGYVTGGPHPAARRVIAFGTSNRNIALAILIGLQAFPGSPATGMVVAGGLTLIALGLVNVAWWRWRPVTGRAG